MKRKIWQCYILVRSQLVLREVGKMLSGKNAKIREEDAECEYYA